MKKLYFFRARCRQISSAISPFPPEEKTGKNLAIVVIPRYTPILQPDRKMFSNCWSCTGDNTHYQVWAPRYIYYIYTVYIDENIPQCREEEKNFLGVQWNLSVHILNNITKCCTVSEICGYAVLPLKSPSMLHCFWNLRICCTVPKIHGYAALVLKFPRMLHCY